MTLDELKTFVTDRILDLEQKRKEYQDQDDYELDDYCAGAIDAYDIVRMKLTE